MLLCYYFMIVKQLYSNMATLFDHLNSNSLDNLNGVKESYQEKEANSKAERRCIRKERAEKKKEAQLEAERMRIRKERAEKYGFKNHDEVIDWLKAGNCAYTACGNIDYNANDNLFYWTRQASDEYDCNFWWLTDKYTEEEIRAHYNNLKEKYGNDLYDEFGYLISPHKNI